MHRPDRSAASPPRILLFLHSFEPGGVEKVALRLAAAWTAQGAGVRAVIGRDDAKAKAPPLDYDILDRRGWTGWCETLWMIARLPGAVVRYRPDVIFCAGNTYAVVAVMLKLLLGKRCPPLLMKVSNDLGRADLGALMRWAYHAWLRLQGRCIDHFVGMAEPMRDEIAVAMRVPVSRVSIIDDPALTMDELCTLAEARNKAGLRGRGRHFLAVGRLVPQKNFALLVEAFAAMRTIGDRLVILGEGPERTRLRTLVVKLGLVDAIDLPGHLDPQSGWFRDSDIFVLSSNYEGVPAVVIEAIAAGLPIVATDCSVSMASLVDHGEFGSLVAVGDRIALAAAMRIPSAQPSCTTSAIAFAARFTIERGAPRYLDLLEGLACNSIAHRSPNSIRRCRCAVCDGTRRHVSKCQF